MSQTPGVVGGWRVRRSDMGIREEKASCDWRNAEAGHAPSHVLSPALGFLGLGPPKRDSSKPCASDSLGVREGRNHVVPRDSNPSWSLGLLPAKA